MKLLIVEDNQNLLNDIISTMESQNIICEKAMDYHIAEDLIISNLYDVVVLDLMLSGGDGISLLKLVKDSVNKSAAVIIISANNALDDKLKGLKLGADDYLTKPFHLSELAARVNALYRRIRQAGQNIIQFNEIEINSDTQEVKVHGNPVILTQKEYGILLLFLSNKNRILSKQTIADYLWGDYIHDLDQLDFIYQHIKNLRKKLLKQKFRPYIANVYGIGYKFNTQAE